MPPNSPVAPPPPGTPASNLRRFGAHLLDSFILITLTAMVASIFAGAEGLALLAKLAVTLGYFTYCHSSRRQATPGKYLLRLYVVDAARHRLTPRRSLERALAYSIPALPAYSSLEVNTMMSISTWLIFIWFLPILYTASRTGVHDMLCRTRVLNGRVGE